MGADIELDLDSAFGDHTAGFGQRLIWQLCDWNALPQEWRRQLRKKYARKIVGPFDIIHDSMRFRLYPAENYCDRVLFGRAQLPERVEHEALLPLLTPDMVFVDIGANVGTYSIFVGTKAPGKCTVLALEPHPRTYQKLLYNLQANGLPTNHVHNVGVGPVRDKILLWSDGGSNIGHTSMVKAGTSNPKVSHEVDIVPLAELLAEANINNIDVLKIDIEGFEDQALVPFFQAQPESQWPLHILIEVSHQELWQHDLMALLDKHGYRETFRTGENRILSRSS